MKRLEKNELSLLLKGDGAYNIQSSQYVPATEPTDVGEILSMIYEAYNINPDIKEQIESVLLAMLGQTNYDVYVVILYIMSQLFKETHGLSPFKLNMSFILPKLKKEIGERREDIKNGIQYPNGFNKKYAWREIEHFNCVSKVEYGFELF